MIGAQDLPESPGHDVLLQRENLQASIAAELATNHGRSWIYLHEGLRDEYLKDASALIDQGMTPYWENHDPGPSPSPELQAEAFELDRAMAWLMDYLAARHPESSATGVRPSAIMEESDPLDWDAWVTIAVNVSEAARLLWSRQFTELHGEPPPTPPPPPRPPAPSAPPSAQNVRRERFAATVGAVLANRHGARWIDLASDVRAGYLSDANALIDAGLMYLRRDL